MTSFNIYDIKDPDTQEILTGIGQVVVMFNYLENEIVQHIEYIIYGEIDWKTKLYDFTKYTVTGLEYIEKIDLLRSLIIEKYGEDKGSLYLPIYNLQKECAEKRNIFAHCFYWFDKEEENKTTFQTFNRKKILIRGKKIDLRRGYSEIQIDDLNELLFNLQEAIILTAFGLSGKFFKVKKYKAVSK